MRASPGVRALTALVTSAVAMAAPARAQWVVNGVPACTAPGIQSDVAVVEDGQGGILIAFHDRRNDAGDIYAQRITGEGFIAPGWPVNGVALCTAALRQEWPHVATDGAGGAFVAWRDYRDTSATRKNPNLVAQHVTGSGTIAPGWPTNGLTISPALVRQTYDQDPYGIRSDGAGGFLIGWVELRAGNQVFLVERLAADGSVAPGWPQPGAPLDSIPDHNWTFEPVLMADGGGAYVAWSRGYETRAQRLTSSGGLAAGWPSGGKAIGCTELDWLLGLESDGSGGFYLMHGAVNQCDGLAVARMDGSGGFPPGWGLCGPAAGTSGLQDTTCLQWTGFPPLLADGAGGLWCTWAHGPEWVDGPRPPQDIVLKYLDSSAHAMPGWPFYGQAVCEQSGDQTWPTMVADGSGGVIVAYQDDQAGIYDIRAARVNADRSIPAGWQACGITVCGADSAQTSPMAVTDGAGGALVAWTDKRNGNRDIYVQRVLHNGAVPPLAVPGPGGTQSVELAPIANPARPPLVLSLRLAGSGPARVELLDAAGRRMDVREVTGPGPHQLLLGRPSLPAGLYWIQLTQGAQRTAQRLCVLR